ncbi:HNH endonuclease signature motif containing protein [Sinomonas mesophila]|uniref:HNH endonuclease signature motif containing protein n=1 Tax=Sinomonas mesophila TaxID=1531955 RepID=UPI000986DB83|nr:HNH endonuclease signature motif containing protein [Sinomonas mesophila]
MGGEHCFDGGPGEEDPDPWLASVPPDPAPWDEDPGDTRFIDPDRMDPCEPGYERMMEGWAEAELAALARDVPDFDPDAALMDCTLTSPAVGGMPRVRVMHAAGLVDSIAGTEAAIARLEAGRAFDIAGLVRAYGGAAESAGERLEAPALAASEIAARLRLSQRTARAMVEESLALTDPAFAPVLEAMQQGRLTRRRAAVILDAAVPVPVAQLADFAAAATGIAAPQDPDRVPTVPALGRRLRRLAEDYADEPLAARKAKAAADRRVDLVPAGDGMCHLTAYLPLETGALIDTRLNAIARALQSPNEARTVNQLRADALADLLLGAGTGSPAASPAGGVRTELVVTVPAATLAGASDTPGEILGYGPIDPEAARRIAAQTKHWSELVVAPLTGAPLAIGRVRYALTAAMRRFLALRDATCRFPGCDKPAAAAEADHTHEWAHGGETDTDNLALLCPEHHRLKTLGHWAVRQIGSPQNSDSEGEGPADAAVAAARDEATDRSGDDAKGGNTTAAPESNTPPGTLEWTSPSGRRYITYPHADPPPPF